MSLQDFRKAMAEKAKLREGGAQLVRDPSMFRCRFCYHGPMNYNALLEHLQRCPKRVQGCCD